MSSLDVANTVQIIDDLVNLSYITDDTLDNVIATMDNVQTKTELGELREKDTISEQFRESAVSLTRALEKKSDSKGDLKSLNSVG